MAVELGCSIVPHRTVASELQAGLLKKVELSGGPFEQPLGILTRRYAARSPSVQKLITSLLSSAV